MPREASPCGEVIAREAVLLMKNPERSFPALLQAEPGICEKPVDLATAAQVLANSQI